MRTTRTPEPLDQSSLARTHSDVRHILVQNTDFCHSVGKPELSRSVKKATMHEDFAPIKSHFLSTFRSIPHQVTGPNRQVTPR